MSRYGDDGNGQRVSIRVNRQRLNREDLQRVKIYLLILAVVLIAGETILNYSGLIRFNLLEPLVDGLILIYFGVFMFNRYNPSSAHKSLLVKRSVWGFLLLLAMIAPSFLVLYTLYIYGMKWVFGFWSSMIYLVALFTVNGIITASWKWNRRFIDVTGISNIILDQSLKGETGIRRGQDFGDFEEAVLMEYISDKIDGDEFINKLGDNVMSERLLDLAKNIKAVLKSRYRW